MQKKEKINQIVIFTNKDGDVKLEKEMVWLKQNQIAELFEKERSVITKHIRNILREKELDDSVCANFAHTGSDEKVYKTNYYNLDMIISVGYRVNSKRGIEFRRWANNVLKEYLIKGYSVNQQRLDNKRIAYFLFLLLMERNKKLLPNIPTAEGLTAIALLIAESNPNQKELIIKLVMNLIE